MDLIWLSDYVWELQEGWAMETDASGHAWPGDASFNYDTRVILRRQTPMWLRPLPEEVREYSHYYYFGPVGVLPEVLYQTYRSTPQEYSQCMILRGLGVLLEVLYQTYGSTPTSLV